MHLFAVRYGVEVGSQLLLVGNGPRRRPLLHLVVPLGVNEWICPRDVGAIAPGRLPRAVVVDLHGHFLGRDADVVPAVDVARLEVGECEVAAVLVVVIPVLLDPCGPAIGLRLAPAVAVVRF